MKVCATLAWYQESPEMLERCVRSLAGVADELVAVDGRWEHFNDGGPALSSLDELSAIQSACEAIGLRRLIYRREHPWKSQVEKRSFMCKLASVNADWIFVIDADEYVEKVDVLPFKTSLATTDLDVASIMHKRGAPALQSPSAIRRIYRASTGVHVETAHMGYKTRDGRWLHGDHAYVNLEPCLDLSAYLLLHHPVLGRTAERLQMREDYCMERRRKQLEAWPAPSALVRA